ncbi:hypothetical protein RND81_02G136500 [Saponaria officinalis]|uniref:Uncharacterized protein n=1 Tax=Saponaria officinalis TaxID=3572 RepID=A0AAW1MPW2_SAPOF
MGNCYAAEAAEATEAAETVLVQHPGRHNKVEKIYWSVSVNDVMSSNPGYNVALVLKSNNNKKKNINENNLKLLRPDDIMHIGQVYRLIRIIDT